MTTTNSGKHEGHFDRWAPKYDRSILQRLMFEPVHKAALDAFGAAGASPGDVLDVGCGTGRLLESAALRWCEARLTGIDVSEAMVAEAQRKHPGGARFTFKKGDASVLPLESASFDAAFSTMSFHHWNDQAAGVREVARVLRPGGLFVLADVLVPFILRPLVSLTDHATFKGQREIRQLLDRAGLAVISQRRFWQILPAQLVVGRK